MKLRGKVAIITGAGRGIGRAIVEAYAAEGARLALVARTPSEVEEAAAEVRRAGGDAVAVQANVAEPDEVGRMVELTLAAYSRVDILVNNAAVIGPVGPFHSNDMRDWAEAIRVNLTGLALCCHSVLPSMIEQGSGKIINLSGAGGVGPSPMLSAYGASKVAVVRFTEMLALEVEEYGIRVNVLGPGQIDTGLLDPIADAGEGMVEPGFLAQIQRTRAGHGASPENAAALAVWLASSESDGLTGRLISAVLDDWRDMGTRIPEIMGSDSHTLRLAT